MFLVLMPFLSLPVIRLAKWYKNQNRGTVAFTKFEKSLGLGEVADDLEQYSAGVSSIDTAFPPCLRQDKYEHYRTGYALHNLRVDKQKTFLPWVSVWGDGLVRVKQLDLLVKDKSGTVVTVYSQTWNQPDFAPYTLNREQKKKRNYIAGGTWENTEEKWCAKLIRFGIEHINMYRHNGVVVLNPQLRVFYKKPTRPNQYTLRLWLSTWPHPKLTDPAQAVGVRCHFRVEGNARMHFGLDMYAHDNVINPVHEGPKRNVWEIIHSPTYSSHQNGQDYQERLFFSDIAQDK